MGNAAVNGSFSTSRPFGAMSQQPTPPEVKQAMEENPGCAFSTSSRSSFTSMNGDVSRKTVQSWLMTCPNQPTMKILEEEHTESGDSARASAGAGGGMQLPGPEDWPGLSGMIVLAHAAQLAEGLTRRRNARKRAEQDDEDEDEDDDRADRRAAAAARREGRGFRDVATAATESAEMAALYPRLRYLIEDIAGLTDCVALEKARETDAAKYAPASLRSPRSRAAFSRALRAHLELDPDFFQPRADYLLRLRASCWLGLDDPARLRLPHR